MKCLLIILLTGCATSKPTMECTKYIKVWERQSLEKHSPMILTDVCVEWKSI